VTIKRNAISPTSRAIAVMVALCAGATNATQHTDRDINEADQNAIATSLFMYEMAHMDLTGKSHGSTLCLELTGHDPAKSVLDVVFRANPGALPASQCTADRSGAYVTTDRRRARFLRIQGIRRVDEVSAEVDFEIYGGELDGEGETIALKRIDGTWTVGDSEGHWVS
jgi:hypothetical protein